MKPAIDHAWARLRMRTPPHIDLEGLISRCRAEMAVAAADWRARSPGAGVAVLEIAVKASGRTRRRLRRYSPFAGASGSTGVVHVRRAAGLDEHLELLLVEAAVAAARAGAPSPTWRLLDAREALALPPPQSAPI